MGNNGRFQSIIRLEDLDDEYLAKTIFNGFQRKGLFFSFLSTYPLYALLGVELVSKILSR